MVPVPIARNTGDHRDHRDITPQKLIHMRKSSTMRHQKLIMHLSSTPSRMHPGTPITTRSTSQLKHPTWMGLKRKACYLWQTLGGSRRGRWEVHEQAAFGDGGVHSRSAVV